MTASTFTDEQKALEGQIAEAREKIVGLKGKVRLVEEELQALFSQREQYELLAQVCNSLEKLEKSGAGHLFWGDEKPAKEENGLLARARAQADQFLDKIAEIEARKKSLEAGIVEEQFNIDEFADEIAQIQEREERKKSEFIVEREISVLPYRPMVMPWDPQGEDRWRFRKTMALALVITFAVGIGMSIWTLPPPEEIPVVEIPERLVKLVKKEPPPPPPQQQPKPEEEKVAENKPKEKATKEEVKKARKRAESAGVLAFKNNFADLMAGNEPALGADAKLGADMRKSKAGRLATGLTQQRSLVMAQATSGSGGIKGASLSRNVGNGNGKGITGVGFSRVTDSIGTDVGEADRPLSNGPGPSRTDEEIQIVFDRYKAALYRIYNRQLRNNPTLRGKMVLRITIEPNGKVSVCKIESSDLKSAALSAGIVARVKRFNFGAKEGVSKITILYPIDFLPAT